MSLMHKQLPSFVARRPGDRDLRLMGYGSGTEVHPILAELGLWKLQQVYSVWNVNAVVALIGFTNKQNDPRIPIELTADLTA